MEKKFLNFVPLYLIFKNILSVIQCEQKQNNQRTSFNLLIK